MSKFVLIPIFCSLVATVGCKPRNFNQGASDPASTNTEWTSPQVTFSNWDAEHARRAQELSNYIKSKPVSWDWWLNEPLGFGGIPLIILKALPHVPDPEIKKIWGGDALKKLGFLPDFRKDKQRPFPWLGLVTTSLPDSKRVIPRKDVLLDENGKFIMHTDAVFFSCAACHTGRVVVGEKTTPLWGAPNAEIEAQLYSGMIYETSVVVRKELTKRNKLAEMIPGHRIEDFLKKKNFADYAAELLADTIERLHKQDPHYFYGKDAPEGYEAKQVAKLLEAGSLGTRKNLALAFKVVVSAGVKTEFVYVQNVTRSADYNHPESGHPRPKSPHTFGPRKGQMDAFGFSSGLASLHLTRPGFYEFAKKDGLDPNHPVLRNLQPDVDLAGNPIQTSEAYRDRANWLPLHPAPSDIKSLFLARDRYFANWDGNQGASARVLASGVSSVGAPEMVNVEVHEPINDLIDDLPPPPYPFPMSNVEVEMAKKGWDVFNQKRFNYGNEKVSCASCHFPNNKRIYNMIGTDRNRALSVSENARVILAELVREACYIFMNEWKNGRSGNGNMEIGKSQQRWCLPTVEKSKLSYAKLTPEERKLALEEGFASPEARGYQRGADRFKQSDSKTFVPGPNDKRGYKADVLHGVWSQAPFLHNGSVPTLRALLSPVEKRPTRFVKGNVNYNTKDVGFVHDDANPTNYQQVNTFVFDTSINGNSNKGHEYVVDGEDLENLLAYLKTL